MDTSKDLAQKQDNEAHSDTDCDAIELYVFSYSEKSMENVDGEAEGKVNVATVIKHYV